MVRKSTAVLLSSLVILAVLACVIGLILQWIELNVQYPPEYVYFDSVSPDGSRIALFSIKYKGTFLFGFTDVEPHSYITIIGTEHGEVLLRETEYHGKIKTDFTELAKKHAPWAMEQVRSEEWGR